MRLAIVGATGAVGREILNVLETSALQWSDLQLYASKRSEGMEVTVKGQTFTLKATPEGPLPADIVLVSAGSQISQALAPEWIRGGSVVIDNSSAFRYREDVPLVVPEVNGRTALGHKGLIANPNCTTAIAVLALFPLHQAYGIKRAIISTYQATSGAGAKGMEELTHQTHRYLHGEPSENAIFAHPIAFNLIPHIDQFQDNGYTKEEMKVLWETRKIMGTPELRLSCTAVRIPTLRAHSEAITLEFERPADPDEAREILRRAPGIDVADDPTRNLYPMPLTASGKYNVEVGRIRSSLVFDGGLDLFVSGDQLLKGAALNAVQIAEYLQKQGHLERT
ncbi:MAG: aspartate-semialdehyde dehydrogenase [Deinococcaceae bacterium]